MADLPSIWKANCSKFPAILETECTSEKDALRKMVEHGCASENEPLDGVIYEFEFPEDGFAASDARKGRDVVFGFASSIKCKLAFYVGDAKTHEDCTGLNLEDGVPLRFITDARATARIKVVPEIPCTITCKALLLSNVCLEALFKQSRVVIKKGTVLKRLQVPGNPIGSYFTFKDADLDKCGVSRYFLNKHGMEEEKQVLWFRAIRDYECGVKRALDTTDTWSSAAPCVCPGGEQIIRFDPSDSKGKTYDCFLEIITAEEASKCDSPASEKSDQYEDTGAAICFSGWNRGNIDQGVTFMYEDDMEIAFVKRDHPVVDLYISARRSNGQSAVCETDMIGDSYMCAASDVRHALRTLQSKMGKLEM